MHLRDFLRPGAIGAWSRTLMLLVAVLSLFSSICLGEENTEKTLINSIAGLKQVPLDFGVNKINFVGLGDQGIIVAMPTHGYDSTTRVVYCTILLDRNLVKNFHDGKIIYRKPTFVLVNFDMGSSKSWDNGLIESSLGDCVSTMSSTTGLDTLDTTVRFFSGSVSGKPATLLFIAELDWSRVKANELMDAASVTRVDVAVFKLVFPNEIGLPEFKRIGEFVTNKSYGDADLALYCELSVPINGYNSKSSDKSECN